MIRKRLVTLALSALLFTGVGFGTMLTDTVEASACSHSWKNTSLSSTTHFKCCYWCGSWYLQNHSWSYSASKGRYCIYCGYKKK